MSAMWAAPRSSAVLALGLVLGVLVTSGPRVPPALAATTMPRVTSRRIAPGVVLQKIIDPAGPWVLHVLRVDPSRTVSLDVATASGTMGAWARPSSMATAHDAIAAVNGDFSVWPGRPSHPFAMDGSLLQTGLRPGVSFAMRRDERTGFIRNHRPHVFARDLAGKHLVAVSAWNTGAPRANEVAGFTRWGGSAETPPKNACSIRLKHASKMRWGPNQKGVMRDYLVTAKACTGSPMAFGKGQVVLSSRTSGAGATFVKGLRKGMEVRLRWDMGMRGVMDTIGGNPKLVTRGTVVVKPGCASWFCGRNPRTGVGVTADHMILLVTVDGRSSNSVGMSLYTFGTYMHTLGAEWAMNLDGGGSSTMWVRGLGVVNDPSDSSGERPVTNALLVLPGADAGERAPLKAPRTSARAASLRPIAVSSAEARAAMDAALADPASTGGLMASLVRESLGRRAALPVSVRSMARAFRASRV